MSSRSTSEQVSMEMADTATMCIICCKWVTADMCAVDHNGVVWDVCRGACAVDADILELAAIPTR